MFHAINEKDQWPENIFKLGKFHMKILSYFVFSFLILVSFLAEAQGRTPVPIVNHESVTWTRFDNRPLEMGEVKNRIIKAAQERHWSIVAGPSEDTLIGILNVRNKHTARVSIQFTQNTFSVKYLDSINLNFSTQSPRNQANSAFSNVEGALFVGVIHPFYNRWAQDLVNGIRNQLQL
jgi:hypothetical protein